MLRPRRKPGSKDDLRVQSYLHWVPDICWRKFRDDMVWGREWWVSLCRAHPTELSICVPPPARGRTGGGLSDVASCTFGRTGFRHPGIPTTGPSRSQSAAGAVALRLGRKRLRNGALPPAAPDRSFGGTPSWGPIVPGLRYRRRANGSPVLFTRRAHPGIAPVLPDEADSQPAFARPTLA